MTNPNRFPNGFALHPIPEGERGIRRQVFGDVRV